MTPFLESALALAAKGLPVFRLAPGSKKPPKDSDWKNEATTDPIIIKRLWENEPYNIGIATGNGILGLDIDMKPGKDGMSEFKKLNIPDEFVNTLIHRTPSGGYHVIWKADTSSIPNSASSLASGLDIRSSGGYLVGPGSVLYNGSGNGKYTVHKQRDIHEAWPNLVRLLSRGQAKSNVVQHDLDNASSVTHARDWLISAPPAIEGRGGDDLTYRTAAKVKDLGVSEDVCLALMVEYWNDRCSPPWPYDDLQKKVAGAYMYGQNAPGSQSPTVLFQGVKIEQPEPAKPTDFHVFRHEDADKYDLKEVSWLFPDLLPTTGTSVLSGPPQSAKTFLVLEMARALATGSAFFDIRADELGGTVIAYGGSEGSGLPLRLKALQEVEPMPITAITIGNLSERGAMTKLADFLYEEDLRMKALYGVPLKLVVIETLSSSGLMNDEDSNAEGAAAIANLATLSRLTNTQVMVTHHPPKSGDGLRGASSLGGNADTHIEIFRQGRDVMRRVDLVKGRNTEQRPIGSFTLLPVYLGDDARNRPVKSMALSMGDAVSIMTSKAPAHVDRFIQALDFAESNIPIRERVDDVTLLESIVRSEFHELMEEDDVIHRTGIKRAYDKCLAHMVNIGSIYQKAIEGRMYIVRRKFE